MLLFTVNPEILVVMGGSTFVVVMEEDWEEAMEEDLEGDMEEDMEEVMEGVMDWVVATINIFCAQFSTLHCSWWSMYRHFRWGTLVDWVEESMEAWEGFMKDLEEIMGE